MTKAKISATKPGGTNTNMDKLLKKLDGNDLLTDTAKRFPVDLHQDIHDAVEELQFCITTKEGKKVTNRMLLTEALADLLKKYEKASAGDDVNVDYVFKKGKSYTSSL